MRESSSFSSSFSSCVSANFRTSCCARAELGFSLYCPHASLQNNDCDFLEFLNRNCCTHLWISSKSGVEKRVQLRLYNCILIFLTLIPRLPALASMVIICSSYVAIIHLLRLNTKEGWQLICQPSLVFALTVPALYEGKLAFSCSNLSFLEEPSHTEQCLFL